jgi:hypothetical protein
MQMRFAQSDLMPHGNLDQGGALQYKARPIFEEKPMRQLAAYIAITPANVCEYLGSSFRGNDSRLPGIGAWETRMA